MVASSIFLEHNGEKLPLTTWAERTGISYYTLLYRVRRGWPIERILALPALAENTGGEEHKP